MMWFADDPEMKGFPISQDDSKLSLTKLVVGPEVYAQMVLTARNKSGDLEETVRNYENYKKMSEKYRMSVFLRGIANLESAQRQTLKDLETKGLFYVMLPDSPEYKMEPPVLLPFLSTTR